MKKTKKNINRLILFLRIIINPVKYFGEKKTYRNTLHLLKILIRTLVGLLIHTRRFFKHAMRVFR